MYKANPSITVSLDIFINQRFVARIPAETFRSDLQAEGYGDGHHAFYFNPFDFLNLPENSIDVRESSSSKQVHGGHRVIHTCLGTNKVSCRKAVIRAQSRWKQEHLDETAPERPNTGELAFFRKLLAAVHFHPALRILEIGAGQGNLIGQILKRKRPFRSYLGLDLSRANVEALQVAFGGARVRFLNADAVRYWFNTEFDLVLASSVCETLFPSFQPLLKNVSRVLPPGGLFAFDLPVEDDRASISRGEWTGDTFVRLYSQAEIRRQLGLVGMELLAADIFEKTPGEHRVFVTALKLPDWPANRLKY